MRQLLLNLGDYRNLNLSLIQRLAYLAQLFSNVFSEKLCEQLLQHLKKWLEVAIVTQKQAQNKPGGAGAVEGCCRHRGSLPQNPNCHSSLH